MACGNVVEGCSHVCAQYLCKKPSLSGLDRQIFGIFFLWGFISVLIGGIVGGSVLSALNPNIVSQPSEPPLNSPKARPKHLFVNPALALA